MVIAPASTGRARRSSVAVIRTDHTNSGITSREIAGARIFIIVEMKFTAPKIEDAPAIWREKIVKSTADPL
jgi:hypothetical protein